MVRTGAANDVQNNGNSTAGHTSDTGLRGEAGSDFRKLSGTEVVTTCVYLFVC